MVWTVAQVLLARSVVKMFEPTRPVLPIKAVVDIMKSSGEFEMEAEEVEVEAMC